MSTYRRVLTLGLLLIVLITSPQQSRATEPLNADTLVETLDTLLDEHPTAQRTTVTLKVVDLETGEVLYDRDGDKLLTPASNLKIYTAAAALDMLGPDYKWTTEIITTSPIDDEKRLENLFIYGTGDPMLDTEQLASMADQLINNYGIRSIYQGVRVAHIPRWHHVPLKGPGWMWDDDPDYYNMSIRSVMLNFNTIKFTVPSDEKKLPFRAEPPSDWPIVTVKYQTDDGGSPVRFEREPFESTISILGVSKTSGDTVSDNITMHDPSPWIQSVYVRMIEERGVEINRNQPYLLEPWFEPIEGRILVSHQGKTLTEALRHFLKVSENAVGEMVLLKLAETQTKEDVSWPVGAKVISDWLINTAGLEEGSFRLVDGSGLSRYNLISAESSTRLLAFMKTHEHFEPFFDGLPIYKVELPEGETWDGKPLKDYDPQRVFAKPGGMSGVSTISGYIKTLDGRWLAFSLLGNGYTGSSKPVRDLRNEVWGELVRYKHN